MNKKNIPIIQAKDVVLKIANESILNNIDLTLYSGEIVGIIGPNGAGKSSLIKMLANVIKPTSGSLKFKEQEYSSVDNTLFAKNLSYLEQQSSIHWPLLVSKVIELGRIPYQGFSQNLNYHDRKAIQHAINTTGISHLLNRVISTLSEGEKMLVALTRILATQSSILLADEPIAALDINHQLLIMELFQSLKNTQTDFSAMVVLHDLNFAARFCDRLILIHEGSIVSQGEATTVLTPENLSRYYKVNAHFDANNLTLTINSRVNG